MSMRPALLATIPAFVLLAPARSFADPTIQLQLDVDARDRPASVCLVQYAKHEGTPIEHFVIPLGKVLTEKEEPKKYSWDLPAALKDHAPFPPERMALVAEALKQLQDRSTTQCGSGADVCAGELRFERDASLVHDAPAVLFCTPNTDPPGGVQRVLFLELLDRQRPGNWVESMQVDGRSISLSRRRDAGGSEGTVISVLGGHYLQLGTVVVIAGRAVLGPVPRCAERELHIPKVARAVALSRKIAVQVAAGKACSRCELSSGAKHLVSLPPGDGPGHDVTLAMRVIDEPPAVTSNFGQACRAIDEADLANLSATWSGEAPAEITLRPTMLRFRWTSGCDHPTSQCPQAKILESNLDCQAVIDVRSTRDGRIMCKYRCPRDGEVAGGAIDLPATVQFTSIATDNAQIPLEVWTQPLGELNATLASERRDRWVPVEFARSWTRERITRRGDEIAFVDVTTPNGASYRFKPGTEGVRRLLLPQAACGDELQVSIVGDRPFSKETIKLQDGKLEIVDPEPLVKFLELGILAGGGWNYRPGSFPSGAFAYFRASARAMLPPSVSPGALSLDVVGYYLLMGHPFEPLHTPSSENADDTQFVLYNRLLAGLGFTGRVSHDWTVSAAYLPAGFGHPVLQADEAAVDRYAYSGGMSLETGFRLSDTFRVEFTALALVPVKYNAFQGGGFVGRAERKVTSSMNLLFGVGLSAWTWP